MRPSDPTATKIFVDAHVESLRGGRAQPAAPRASRAA